MLPTPPACSLALHTLSIPPSSLTSTILCRCMRAANYNQANARKLLQVAVRLQLALVADPSSVHSRVLATHLVPLLESVASFLSLFSCW